MADKKIIAYKGFDQDLKCRDFQYEIGKEYIHKGDVKPCESGFHACQYPLDVFRYYNLAGSRFAEVEAAGEIVPHEDKICCEKIIWNRGTYSSSQQSKYRSSPGH